MTNKFACLLVLLGSLMPLALGCGSSNDTTLVEIDPSAEPSEAEQKRIAEEEAGSTNTSTQAP